MASKSVHMQDEKKLKEESWDRDTLGRTFTRCFKLGSKIFVPTYRQTNALEVEYVGPESTWLNAIRYTERELMFAGAVPTREYLWTRGYIKNGK
jgi:hypothetical protein